MKLGELKVACIKLMNDNDTAELDPDTISTQTDYDSRLKNIIEPINRAIDEAAKAYQLPKKTVVLTTTAGTIGDYFTRYDLDTIVVTGFTNDVLRVEKVAYEYEDEYDAGVPIRKEGHNVLILPKLEYGTYIVTYSPTYSSRFTYDSLDTEVITDIPDDILGIIPYFVKGELFEEDNAQTALLATNKFHSYLANRTIERNERATSVKNVYTQVW